MSGRKIILLVNTGTPDKPEWWHVGKYLAEFLRDRRVMDMPWLLRKIHWIIVPLRTPVATKRYKKVWTDEGSPLSSNLTKLVGKIRGLLSDDYTVMGAMNYGNPSVANVLNDVRKLSPEKIMALPLFPHYASSCAGSINVNVMRTLSRWPVIPEVHLLTQFYSHPAFIEALVAKILEYDINSYDHILFSYHGLPVKHLSKACSGANCGECISSGSLPSGCKNICYRMNCYDTTALIAARLGLNEEMFSTAFQSRFHTQWIEPFTDKVLIQLLGVGKRKVLIVTPSFVSDCLETIIEIGEEHKEMFLSVGGEKFDLVQCLNDSDKWAEAVIKIIEEQSTTNCLSRTTT